MHSIIMNLLCTLLYTLILFYTLKKHMLFQSEVEHLWNCKGKFSASSVSVSLGISDLNVLGLVSNQISMIMEIIRTATEPLKFSWTLSLSLSHMGNSFLQTYENKLHNSSLITWLPEKFSKVLLDCLIQAWRLVGILSFCKTTEHQCASLIIMYSYEGRKNFFGLILLHFLLINK